MIGLYNCLIVTTEKITIFSKFDKYSVNSTANIKVIITEINRANKLYHWAFNNVST